MSFLRKYEESQQEHSKMEERMSNLREDIKRRIYDVDSVKNKGEREAYSLYRGQCTELGLAGTSVGGNPKGLVITYNGDRSERYESFAYGFVCREKELVEFAKGYVSFKVMWKYMVAKRDYQGGYVIFPEYITKVLDHFVETVREVYPHVTIERVRTEDGTEYYVFEDRSKLA